MFHYIFIWGGAREAELQVEYRAAKRRLQAAIKRAKNEALRELREILEWDPGENPNRTVKDKMRPWTSPLI